MLSAAAVISLALGLFQDFGTPPEQVTCPDGSEGCTLPRVDWVEGVAIMIAIVIVSLLFLQPSISAYRLTLGGCRGLCQ